MVAAAGALLVALAAVHTAPVRALVLRRVAAVVRTSYGIDVRAGSLSYNVLTLSAELRGVELAFVDTPSEPFAAADALGVTFGARTLIGDVNLQRISLAAPRINIRRHDDGTDNLPRVSGAQSTGERFVLPAIAVDDLDVSFQQPDISAVIHGASVQLTSAESGKVSAAIDAQRGLRMTVGDRTIDVETVAGAFDIEGQQLDIRDLTAARPGTALRANGRIAFRGEASTVDVSVTGSSEIESWWAEFSDEAGPVGHVEATAHVTGLLSEPTITFETNGRSLAWSDVHVSTIRTTGGYGSGQLSLNTLTLGIAGGTVEGHGTIAVDDTRRPSRIEARWAEIDARQIPGTDRLAGTLSKSGTAIVEWRREAPSASPLFGISATTGIVASGRTTAIDVRGSGQADRWHVEVAPRDRVRWTSEPPPRSAWTLEQWEASAIDGRVVMRTTDLPTAIRQAQAFGAPASIDPATAAGDDRDRRHARRDAGRRAIDRTDHWSLRDTRRPAVVGSRRVVWGGCGREDVNWNVPSPGARAFVLDPGIAERPGVGRLIDRNRKLVWAADRSDRRRIRHRQRPDGGARRLGSGDRNGWCARRDLERSDRRSRRRGNVDDRVSANRRARGRRCQRGLRAGCGHRPRTRACAQSQRGPRCLDWSRGTEHLRGPGYGRRLRHP